MVTRSTWQLIGRVLETLSPFFSPSFFLLVLLGGVLCDAASDCWSLAASADNRLLPRSLQTYQESIVHGKVYFPYGWSNKPPCPAPPPFIPLLPQRFVSNNTAWGSGRVGRGGGDNRRITSEAIMAPLYHPPPHPPWPPQPDIYF